MEVRSFLRLAGYYCIFVQDLFNIATPLTNLTKKTTRYEWADNYVEAFQELKRRLTIAPMLALPHQQRI